MKVSNPHIEKEEHESYRITNGYRKRWEEFQQWKESRL
jgi:hypothetical protein